VLLSWDCCTARCVNLRDIVQPIFNIYAMRHHMVLLAASISLRQYIRGVSIRRPAS
jgi:hypothetical protein